MSATGIQAEAITIETFKLEQELATRRQVDDLLAGGVLPGLATVSDQPINRADAETPTSRYVKALTGTAKRMGVVTDTYGGCQIDRLVELVDRRNAETSADGIVVTLPLSVSDEEQRRAITDQVLGRILPTKDVDGLNPDSGVVPATAEAAYNLLRAVEPDQQGLIVVRGGYGHVGRALVKLYKHSGEDVHVVGEDTPPDVQLKLFGAATVVASLTGQPWSLTPEHFAGASKQSPKTLLNVGMARNQAGKIVGDFSPALEELSRERGWNYFGNAASLGGLATLTVVSRTVARAASRLPA